MGLRTQGRSNTVIQIGCWGGEGKSYVAPVVRGKGSHAVGELVHGIAVIS